jgi:hypothetical protein
MPRRVVVLIGGVLILAALGTALISGIIRAPNMGPPSDLPTLPPQRSESPTAVPTIVPIGAASATANVASRPQRPTPTPMPCKIPPTSPAILSALNAVEQIPDYSDARKVALDTQLAYSGNTPISATTFLTADSYEAVNRFYRTTLARQGWEEAPAEPALTFLWTDATGVIPWKLRFDLREHETYDGLQVTVVLQGVPDVSAVPLYPGAAQVTVETRTPENESSINCVTRYQVPASPEEVRAFYQRNLGRYGWQVAYLPPDGPDPAIHLGTPQADPASDMYFKTFLQPSCTICGGSATVIINTSPVPDGGSRVTMYASGVVEELLCHCSDIPDGR